MSTLLLIGATGFFGKSFLDAFRRGLLEPWGVRRVVAAARGVDRLKSDVPAALLENVELCSMDLRTTSVLPEAEYVIHAAASTNVDRYLTDRWLERSNITTGADNYCRLAPVFHASSRIVYVSSGAIYGIQPQDMSGIREDFNAGSLTSLAPGKFDYAIAKREAEATVRQVGAERRVNVSIARCFAFVGPWLPREQHFAIGNFLRDGLAGRTIHVKARQPVYRSYMFADDLIEWLMTIASSASPSCPTYNVGSDEAVSIHELAGVIGQQFGLPVTAAPITDDLADRYVPSIEKAAAELGLKVKFDLTAAIEKTVEAVGRGW